MRERMCRCHCCRTKLGASSENARIYACFSAWMRHEKLFDMDAETNSYRPYHRAIGRHGASGEPVTIEIRSPGRKWRTGTGGWFGLFGDENCCKPSKVSIAKELQDTFSWSNGDASGLSGCTEATLYAVERSAVVHLMLYQKHFLFPTYTGHRRQGELTSGDN